MAKKPRGSGWGARTFTPHQWLKRDLRGATTRAEQAMREGRRPISLPKIKCLDEKDGPK